MNQWTPLQRSYSVHKHYKHYNSFHHFMICVIIWIWYAAAEFDTVHNFFSVSALPPLPPYPVCSQIFFFIFFWLVHSEVVIADHLSPSVLFHTCTLPLYPRTLSVIVPFSSCLSAPYSAMYPLPLLLLCPNHHSLISDFVTVSRPTWQVSLLSYKPSISLLLLSFCQKSPLTIVSTHPSLLTLSSSHLSSFYSMVYLKLLKSSTFTTSALSTFTVTSVSLSFMHSVIIYWLDNLSLSHQNFRKPYSDRI